MASQTEIGTTAGRDDFYSNLRKPQAPWASFDSGEIKAGSPMDFNSDVPSSGGELYAFKILQSTTSASKVVVARGSVQSPNGDPVFPPQTNVNPQSGSQFNFGSTIYLNVTLSEGTVNSAEVSTSADGVSATKAVIVIGSVSSDGEITQLIRNGLLIYSCGDNQFFQGIFS